MTDERDRMNVEELGEIASAPFKTEIKKKTVVDDDGYEFDIPTEVQKYMTPSGEVVAVENEKSRFVSCGHRVINTSQVMRCVYGGHTVCKNCIRVCDGCGEMVCLAHSAEYHDEEGSFRLCWDCEDRFKLEMVKESSLINKIFRRKSRCEKTGKAKN
jgi:hypothetical protein